jgi:hypothetical protein
MWWRVIHFRLTVTLSYFSTFLPTYLTDKQNN